MRLKCVRTSIITGEPATAAHDMLLTDIINQVEPRLILGATGSAAFQLLKGLITDDFDGASKSDSFAKLHAFVWSCARCTFFGVLKCFVFILYEYCAGRTCTEALRRNAHGDCRLGDGTAIPDSDAHFEHQG